MNGPNTLCGGLLLTTIALASGCNVNLGFGEALVGSGVATEEFREIESFSVIEVGGALKVDAVVGQTQSVSVKGDDNIVPFVTTEVHGDALKIQLDHNGRLDTKQPLVITLVSPELIGAGVSGACHVQVGGISGTDFRADLSGASTVVLEGECQKLTAGISGASTLNAKSLNAKTASIQASGASNAHVLVTESITGNASGASTVRYTGDPAHASVSTSGASSAKAE